MRRFRFATKEEYNAWFRAYRARRREWFREFNRKYNKQWRKENGYHNEERWHRANKVAVQSQIKLRRAVAQGKIKRLPCEECEDVNIKSVAHHDDYAKPFEVRWLCKVHHRRVHYRGVDNLRY